MFLDSTPVNSENVQTVLNINNKDLKVVNDLSKKHWHSETLTDEKCRYAVLRKR